MDFPLDETFRIAAVIGESDPKNLWHLASFLSLPTVFERRNKMLKEAKKRYESGELVNDGSRRRTLAGCFLSQITKEEIKEAHRIRVIFRQEHGISDSKYVPKEFLNI